MPDQHAMTATERRPRSTEEIIRRQNQYIEEIQPLIKIMVDIMNMQPVRYLVKEGQLMGREILWQAGSREVYDEAERQIKATEKRIFEEI